MLKRQTVWLLTMLSLVVVLSVYYVTAPKDMNDNIDFTNNEDVAKQQVVNDKEKTDVAVEEMETKDGGYIDISVSEMIERYIKVGDVSRNSAVLS